MRFQEKIMAHAGTLCRAPSAPPTTSRHLLAQLGALLNEWRRRARSRRELATLCDRCLRDMGVTRYDADREVRKPFWRA
jgi:uncharacterized protein YjiS (DUF1127 family)